MMNNKKVFFLFFFTFLLLNSCKRDYEYDVNAKIEGSWKPIKITVFDYIGGIQVSKSEDATVCQQQSRMIYKADLSATEIRYDAVSGNCEKTLERNFTYTYNSDSRSLVHTYTDGSSKSAQVVSITNTTLIVKSKKDIGGTLYDVEVTNTKID